MLVRLTLPYGNGKVPGQKGQKHRPVGGGALAEIADAVRSKNQSLAPGRPSYKAVGTPVVDWLAGRRGMRTLRLNPPLLMNPVDNLAFRLVTTYSLTQ